VLYSHKNLHEVEYLLAFEELQRHKSKGVEQQQKVDLVTEIESVVSRAKELTERTKDDKLSNRKKTTGIRDNRSVEKAKRREREGFELEKSGNENTSNIVEIDSQEVEQPQSLQPNYLDILRQKQEERKREKDK
jgi:hypothetical protein